MSLNRLDVLVFGTAAVAAVLGLLFVFQVFFRYQYVRAGTIVTRVDRASGRTCVMPCLPAATPSPPTPAPTPLSLDHQEQSAIVQVQSNSRTQRMLSTVVGEGYAWSAVPAAQAAQNGSDRGSADETDAFLVCYCDQEGFGLRWEAHLKSREAYFANDNKKLSERYGARLRERIASTPTPGVTALATVAPRLQEQPQQAPPAVQPQEIAGVDVVREYYRLWNQGDYRAMYAMLSPRFQTKLPYDKYVKYHSLVLRLDVDVEPGYAPSEVNVRIVSRDREKDGTITTNTNVGIWHLAWMDGTWKLDAQDAHDVK